MFVKNEDIELIKIRDDKTCVICGSIVDYNPIYCNAMPCNTCSQKQNCDVKGLPVNVPLCSDKNDNNIMDCRLFLHAWQLLERKNRLNYFYNLIPELEGLSYPKDKYMIFKTIKSLNKNVIKKHLEDSYGLDIWQHLK